MGHDMIFLMKFILNEKNNYNFQLYNYYEFFLILMSHNKKKCTFY